MHSGDFVDYLDTMFDDLSDSIVDDKNKPALSQEDILFLYSIGLEPLLDELS
jgi:hypothetical protein